MQCERMCLLRLGGVYAYEFKIMMVLKTTESYLENETFELYRWMQESEGGGITIGIVCKSFPSFGIA